jgi:hypothetical protein
MDYYIYWNFHFLNNIIIKIKVFLPFLAILCMPFVFFLLPKNYKVFYILSLIIPEGLIACSYILYNTLFSTLGIDFVIGDVDWKIEPVGIEVDSHDCTINCQLFEFMNPHTQGNAVKPYVETMIARSHDNKIYT